MRLYQRIKMITLPAEWERQQCILMSFPHEETDWVEDTNPESLNEALSPFIRIAQAIAYGQAVYIICKDKSRIASMFCSTRNMTFIEIPTNDTWIRDYGYITVYENGQKKLLDFTFNGWGDKFEASLDNAVNTALHQKGYMGITPLESLDFILEGGSIESDGEGTILSTSQCLCNPNRNPTLTQTEIENRLKTHLGAKRVLWLDHGYLAGDDTDSHIDMLARFVDKHTIVYLQCNDTQDEHYQALQKMETQLKSFKDFEGNPYRLIALPMTKPIYNAEGQRLPASYANFLITNEAIIYPSYQDENDKVVGEILKDIYPQKEIIPVNCLKLIEEGGSLHCSTMHIPY